MDFDRFLDRREWLETAVAVVLIALVLTATMATHKRVSPATFGVLCLMGGCFAAAYRVIYLLLLPALLQKAGSVIRRGLLHAAALLIAAIAGGEAATRMFVAFGSRNSDLVAPLRIRVVAIGLAVLVSIRLVEFGYETLRGQIRKVELREERARRQALRAELAALQARTDPHFLFNSLNTIAGLIEEDPGRAVEVVTRLSGLFRHTLHGSRVASVPLEEEIRAASTLLEILALRFDDRLSWTVRSSPDLDSALVPPLILQPLVENAIFHGTSERHRTEVRIEAQTNEDRLLLLVEDDGPAPGESRHQGSGTSLVDLAERLALLYGPEACLETGPAPGGGFRASLSLPLQVGVEEPTPRQEMP